MLNWFRRWKNNRNRAIFSFWDGAKQRVIDPLTAWRALRAHPDFDPERDIEGIRQDDEQALSHTLAAVREAFGVKAFADGGLTEAETLALLAEFMAYIGAVKKNTSPPPISQPPTEARSSEASTTKPDSDCTSTSDEPNCVNPAPC